MNIINNVVLYPAWELSVKNIIVNTNQTKAGVVAKASKELAVDSDKLVIRPIMAFDFNITSWKTPICEEGCTTDWINIKNKEQTYITITKIIQLSLEPTISEIKFMVQGAIVSVFELDILYSVIPLIQTLNKLEPDWLLTTFGDISNIRMEAYLACPIVVCPETSLKVKVKPYIDSNGDRLILGGFVVEREGATFNIKDDYR